MPIIQKTLSGLLFSILYSIRWKQQTFYSNWLFLNPSTPPKDLKKHYQQTLKNLSAHSLEFLNGLHHFKKLPPNFTDYPTSTQNTLFHLHPDSLLALQKAKEGGLLLTAHYGNYEALGAWLSQLGIPLKTSYAPQKPKLLNRILEKLRSTNTNSYSILIKNPKTILSLIQKRKLFCLLADQDYRQKKTPTSLFFNQQVQCNPIPNFILKHHPQCPVFFAYIEETPYQKTLHFSEISSENFYTHYHQHLEKIIQNSPHHWYGWVHRRFYSSHPFIYNPKPPNSHKH